MPTEIQYPPEGPLKTDRQAFDPENIFVDMPVLLTPRLRLRPFLESDAESMLSVYGDAVVGEFNRWKVMENAEEMREKIRLFQRQFKEGMRVRWAVTLAEDDLAIGDFAFVTFDARSDKAEVGFNLARGHWRKGIMYEAARAALRHGFQAWGLNRVEAQAMAANAASGGLLEKVGFRKEGLLREGGFVRGKFVDLELYGMLRSDWK